MRKTRKNWLHKALATLVRWAETLLPAGPEPVPVRATARHLALRAERFAR